VTGVWEGVWEQVSCTHNLSEFTLVLGARDFALQYVIPLTPNSETTSLTVSSKPNTGGGKPCAFFFSTLVTGPRRSLSLKLSNAKGPAVHTVLLFVHTNSKTSSQAPISTLRALNSGPNLEEVWQHLNRSSDHCLSSSDSRLKKTSQTLNTTKPQTLNFTTNP